MVEVEMRDEHRVDAAERRCVDLSGPAKVQHPWTQHGIREEPHTVHLDENGCVPHVHDPDGAGRHRSWIVCVVFVDSGHG